MILKKYFEFVVSAALDKYFKFPKWNQYGEIQSDRFFEPSRRRFFIHKIFNAKKEIRRINLELNIVPERKIGEETILYYLVSVGYPALGGIYCSPNEEEIERIREEFERITRIWLN